MTTKPIITLPSPILTSCHLVKGFTTSSVLVTSLSTYTNESLYTISFLTSIGSCTGFILNEWARTPSDTEASDLAYLFSNTETVSIVLTS